MAGLTSTSRHHTYSRKQKSLGLLCSNFLSMYNHDGVQLISLDDAASRLGVERRRIYDIVNVLESVGVLARKAKNQYSWKGFGAIPKALQELKDEAMRENFCASAAINYAKISDDEEDDELGSQNSNLSVPKTSSSSKTDNRREKSLALLTQNFVKLFICSKEELISLDEAARLLLGDGHNSSIMRTKVRRLYDIANVLSSMNLIEKTHASTSRKPAFRWLGLRGKDDNETATTADFSEPKKRTFGIDVTNISFKRSKFESSIDQNMKKDSTVKIREARDNFDGVYELGRSSLDKESKQTSKSYQFGPFAPVTVAKTDRPDGNNNKRVHDWESLASTYRPQYQNQALKELFSHYVEAWKSWYSEAVEKQQ